MAGSPHRGLVMVAKPGYDDLGGMTRFDQRLSESDSGKTSYYGKHRDVNSMRWLSRMRVDLIRWCRRRGRPDASGGGFDGAREETKWQYGQWSKGDGQENEFGRQEQDAAAMNWEHIQKSSPHEQGWRTSKAK